MSRQIKTIFFIIFISLSGQALSQKSRPEGKLCNTLEGRLEYIQTFTSSYHEQLMRKVERVPPDVEKYLSDEYRDSISTGNESRYQKIVNNQYYYPWKLRESHTLLVDESKTGYQKISGWGMSKRNPQENEMIFYTNLLGKNYEFLDSISSYQKFDSTRKTPYLITSDYYTIGLISGIYKTVIQDLIVCSFKKGS